MSKVTLCWQDCQVIPIVTWHGRLILVNALHWINTYVRLCGTYCCAITAFKLTYMGVVCSSDKVVMNIIWERKKKNLTCWWFGHLATLRWTLECKLFVVTVHQVFIFYNFVKFAYHIHISSHNGEMGKPQLIHLSLVMTTELEICT